MRKELRRMVENLEGRRGAITKFKTELRHLEARRTLPVPYELLEHIFQYYVHSYGQLPENLLLVCRTFYVVAMNCRALWTSLDPVRQFKLKHLPRWAGTFIQSRVARSNPAPLDIDFTEVGVAEMTSEFAKEIIGIPTLLQRCRSVVISRSSELQFFQGFQPLLERVTMGIRYWPSDSPRMPWDSVGECPKLRSLKLKTTEGRKNWPKHLFQQLTHLEIKMPSGTLSYHHDILPMTLRLQSLTLWTTSRVSQPIIHQSLQSLVLHDNILYVVNRATTLGDIICPNLRRLEIWVRRSERLSIHLRDSHKLSYLRLVCSQGASYNEEKDFSHLDEKWSDSIIELLRSVGAIKRLRVKSGIEVISALVESLEADLTLCPNLASLHAETLRPLSSTQLNTEASEQGRSRLLEFEVRISERCQRVGGDIRASECS
jgi:hypothetical protein